MNIRDHLHLFAGEITYGFGSTPRKYLLNKGLSALQKLEALTLVQQDYPHAGYGTYLDEQDNVIRVGSAD